MQSNRAKIRQAVSRLLRPGRRAASQDEHEWHTLAEYAESTREAPGSSQPAYNRDLASEVRTLLKTVGVATADEIARQIAARTQAVRQLLADEEHFRRVDPRDYGRSPKAKLYVLSDDEALSEPLSASESEGDHQTSLGLPDTGDGSGRGGTDAVSEADDPEAAETTADDFDYQQYVPAWLSGQVPDPWREARLRWLLSYPVEKDGSE